MRSFPLIGLCLLAGLLGFGLAWTVWHLWLDHLALHQMAAWINEQAAKAVK